MILEDVRKQKLKKLNRKKLNKRKAREKMVTKKELVKAIKDECLVELDTKKLMAKDIPILEAILKDFQNLQLSSLKIPKKRKDIEEDIDGEGEEVEEGFIK